MKDHFLRRKWNTSTQQVDYLRTGGRYARATNYRRVVVRTLRPRPVAQTWALPAFSFGSFAAYPLLAVGLLVFGALAVAVTVGLALLPLYLPSKAVSVPSVTGKSILHRTSHVTHLRFSSQLPGKKRITQR